MKRRARDEPANAMLELGRIRGTAGRRLTNRRIVGEMGRGNDGDV